VHLGFPFREEDFSPLRPHRSDRDPAKDSRVNENFERISPLKIRNAECSRRLLQEPTNKGCGGHRGQEKIHLTVILQ
jgi:hypothetical protein